MTQCVTLRIPKGIKNAVSICNGFCLDFLIRNEKITSKEYKTKKLFEKILHVGQVTNLKSWESEIEHSFIRI